ncbi:hypothetical protein E2542_SST12889 [Spatholobus suberectus]|nr:hypothetical protein E2542_SST12889 [Spatholobus suberectus]
MLLVKSVECCFLQMVIIEPVRDLDSSDAGITASVLSILREITALDCRSSSHRNYPSSEMEITELSQWNKTEGIFHDWQMHSCKVTAKLKLAIELASIYLQKSHHHQPDAVDPVSSS